MSAAFSSPVSCGGTPDCDSTGLPALLELKKGSVRPSCESVVLSDPSAPKAASTRKGRAVEMRPLRPKSDARRPPLVCGCLPQLTPQPLPLQVPSVDHPWCVCIVPWITCSGQARRQGIAESGAELRHDCAHHLDVRLEQVDLDARPVLAGGDVAVVGTLRLGVVGRDQVELRVAVALDVREVDCERERVAEQRQRTYLCSDHGRSDEASWTR